MQTSGAENNFNSLTVSGQRKMNRSTRREGCRLLRLSPLICVIAGSILTVVGQSFSLKICQIAGPVVMTVGGLLLVFITFWSSRQAQLHTEGSSSNCEPVNTQEQHVNCSDEDSSYQLGAIHHVEVWIPSVESSGPEIVPPSYEEAVSNYNNTESVESGNAGSVVAYDEQGQYLVTLPSQPPSYEESCVNTQDCNISNKVV